MKKTLVAILALVFVLSIGSAAFAAPANPFVDVPAKHWSYDAVSKLVKAGIVDGYGDGYFRGDKALTRYEMAQVVAKAMAKSDKADAENKALIDKLAVEFAAELNNLGVRVTALEKKVDNTKFSGDIRVRRDWTQADNAGAKTTAATTSIRTRLVVTGAINDSWTYKGRFQSQEDLLTSGNSATTSMNYMYVQGPVLNANMKIGRFTYTPVYGLVLDSYLDGVEASFGKDLKVAVRYGKQSVKAGFNSNADIVLPMDYNTSTNSTNESTIYTGAELSYSITPETTVKAGYHDFKANNLSNNARIWELGVDTKFNADWTGYASYAKSNAKDQNRGWIAGIQYKAADVSKPGSYQIWANYRDLQAYTTWDTTLDLPYVAADKGGKGWEVGFSYTLDKNILWTTAYEDLKATTTDDMKKKFIRSQVNFYF